MKAFEAQDTATTEIVVPGANCPWCVNETLELLRAQPGVVSVEANFTGQSMRIHHRGVPIDDLIAIVRLHLHGDRIYGAEHVMVEIRPTTGRCVKKHEIGRHDV